MCIDNNVMKKNDSLLGVNYNRQAESNENSCKKLEHLCSPYDYPHSLIRAADLEDPSTGLFFNSIGSAFDLETHDRMTEDRLYQKIFACHFGHLAIIFLWTAGNLFHVAWQGNFEQWILDPLKVSPIAHAIWDPHFGSAALDAFAGGGVYYPVITATSGLYNWWYTIGMRSNLDLFYGALGLICLASICLIAGWLHLQPKYSPKLSWFKNNESRLNHHLAGLFGSSSLFWSGHLVHVAIPESRGQHVRWNNFLEIAPHPTGIHGSLLAQNMKLQPTVSAISSRDIQMMANGSEWSHWPACLALDPDKPTHIFGTSEGAGTAILTFTGGFHPQTGALWLTDIAHHHLAIAVVFIVAGHMYRTTWGIGHSLKEILESHVPPNGLLGSGHKGLFETITDSLHMQLGLALAGLGVITSLVAQHMYALNPYVFLSENHTAQVSLYVHHQFIAGFLMVGAFAHGAIFFVRDYNPETNHNNVLARMLQHKEAIISHLSWVSLFLGFHTLGLYIHNDVCLAFGNPERQILFEPIFAQYIQAASGKNIGMNVLLSDSTSPASFANTNLWFPGWIEAINDSGNSLFLDIGPGDFLVHHAIALGLHTTALILIKGALDARGSRLMPDKKDFGYSFPCDGPGRGGTCDISAWDAFYLAMFWMLNTIGWTAFYWHWKHLALWSGDAGSFGVGSTSLMGWFSAYLWYQSAGVVAGAGGSVAFPLAGEVSVWYWVFLFGHLIWATGFMFLISWRGYWQELIETLVWAHTRTPIAHFMFQWREKPIALSIVGARLVGLAHFTTGYVLVYASFIIPANG
jgi:photosystem I P700 chlorophyll a apoprotein A2